MRPTPICSIPRNIVYPRNPIITVTEHTPTPSPDYMKRQVSSGGQVVCLHDSSLSLAIYHFYSFIFELHLPIEKGSFDSQLDALSSGGSIPGGGGNGGYDGVITGGPNPRGRGNILRSHTDSNIDYTGVDESEAPGSSFYITRDGGIDFEIVLLAVQNVFKRDLTVVSLRVLEAGLNICELLLEMGVLKLGEHAHEISMTVIRRALLVLGCQNGCNDGKCLHSRLPKTNQRI